MGLESNIIQALEQNLLLPKEVILPIERKHNNDPRLQVKLDIVEDASMLKCGCVVSEGLISELNKLKSQGLKASCPTCSAADLSIVGPITPLRNLYKQLQFYKDLQLGGDDRISVDSVACCRPSDKPQKQQSLLTLFHEVAIRVMKSPMSEERTDGRYLEEKKAQNGTEDSDVQKRSTDSLDSPSNGPTASSSEGVFKDVSLESKLVSLDQSGGLGSIADEKKELYFVKCFPMYRKRSQYNTHHRLFRAKSRLFNNTYISRNCDRFALISEEKWEIYNIGVENKPLLYCCGTVAGEYGPHLNNLKMPTDAHDVLYSKWKHVSKSKRKPELMGVPQWEHLYCRIANDVFAIAGTSGYLRVFNLSEGGKPVFTHCLNFPIRCIDVNPDGTLVACSITGRDRSTGAEQALIALQLIEREDKVFRFPKHFTVTLPYRDPINTIQFSSDGNYLSCSTALESRFFVVSLKNINEPRLVMKSLRLIDTSQPSEGITSANLFPGNPKLMCITAAAINSPPIVIDTRIGAMPGLHTIAQPKMLFRLDEVGCKIHGCEISPRGDSIAFLGRNGTVYMMSVPHMLNNQTRRIFVVEIVATASRARESASMRFSRDGDKLFLLDRKGILYVEDFAYNLPNHHEVTRCKQLI